VRSNIDVFGFEISKEDIDKLDKLDRGNEGAVTWNRNLFSASGNFVMACVEGIMARWLWEFQERYL
jgi:hypothetical protein